MGVSYNAISPSWQKGGNGDRCVRYHIWYYYVQSRHTQHHGIHVLNVTGHQFLDSTHIVSISDAAHTSLKTAPVQLEGCYSTRHTPFRRRSVCSSCSPRAGHGGQVVLARGHGEASYTNYRHGGR